MHICFVGEVATAGFITGGIGTFTANLVPKLIEKGCKISIISYKQQQQAIEIEESELFTIYWINTHQWGPLRAIKKIIDTNRLLQRINQHQKIDIVETAENGLFKIKKRKGIRYLIRLHGGHRYFFNTTADTPFSSRKIYIEKSSLKKADAIIGVSQFVLNETIKEYPFLKTKKPIVIPNPIVCSKFNISDVSKTEPGKILFYGSLTEKKGIRQLIEALPLVNEEISNASLHIFGKDVPVRPTGVSYKAILEQLIIDLALTNVHLNEAIPNHLMPTIIETAEVVVLPSHMESMPLAWLEAMAMAKPVILSKTGPGPEVVEPEVDGLICDPFSPHDIAQKIIWMMQHPTEASSMGLAARNKILLNYDIELIAEKNLQFYKQVLE